MDGFIITTDSCSDLSSKMAEINEVAIIDLTVNIEGKEYNGRQDKILAKEVYDFMRKGGVVFTSQASPKRVEEFFEPYLNRGQDIIHLSLSAELSGMYNSCKIAAEELKKKYPERRIEIIDTLSGSLGQGLLVLEAVKEKRKGKRFDEIVDIMGYKRFKMINMFTVDNLVYLQRGGRISKAKEVIGSIMGVKPILVTDNIGKIVRISNIRGKKNAIIEMIEKMKEIIDFKLSDVLAIGHSDCLKDAKFIKNLIKEKINIKNIILEEIGPVMGSHCGPGAVAIFFMGEKRFF